MFEQLIPSFTNLVFLFMRSIHIYSCYGYLHCLILLLTCAERFLNKIGTFIKERVNNRLTIKSQARNAEKWCKNAGGSKRV